MILKVVQTAIDKAKNPDEGWYKVEIIKTEDKLAKDQSKGPNYNCECTIRIMQNLQTGADMSELEKEKGAWINYNSFMMNADLICAAMNIPSMEALVGQEIDLQSILLHKQFNAHVKHGIYNNKPVWEYDQFLPDGVVPF